MPANTNATGNNPPPYVGFTNYRMYGDADKTGLAPDNPTPANPDRAGWSRFVRGTFPSWPSRLSGAFLSLPMHPAYFHTVLDTTPPCGGLPEAWAVVTAYAPTGTVRRPEVNAAADVRLKAALEALGTPVWRVTGRSPEGDHAEPGWGAVISLTVAKSLGRSFEQKAVFWIQHGELWVADCSPCGAGVRIGALGPKLNAAPTPFAGRERLVAGCGGDPVRIAAMLRFLGPSGDRARAWAEFVRDADDSSYALPSWCEAAAEFQHRLESAGRVSLFAKKLGYLCCCAESQGPVPPALRPEFVEALRGMWDAYGYDG